MGQYWLMVDLEGHTQLDLGKLGESLPYESTTAEFISYLSVPPKRPVLYLALHPKSKLESGSFPVPRIPTGQFFYTRHNL